jgi:signal peptidase
LQASDSKKVFVVTLIVTIYMLLSFFRFSGLMAYIIPSVCWSLLALTTLYICGPEKIRLWFSKLLTITAALLAAFQIMALIFVAFFTGFGKSPYAFTPIATTINIAYFSSALIGLELSRAYLIKSCPRKRIFTGIALIALFYTFISIPLTKFTAQNTAAETAKFLGSDLLPTLAQSILATYLALLGGPTASIAYLGTLTAFEWLSPILPNPPWTIQALITALIPIAGFLAINQTTSPFTLMRLGIISRSEVIGRIRRTKKSSPISWIAIAMFAVILIWGSTGLLGFQPNIIASGSMRPTLDVGDIAITVPARPEAIQVGDIIQYWKEGEPAPIIHRVIEVYKSDGTTHIVTKGDANNAPDDPITPTQPVGKLILTIPKLGWISIALKTAITNILTFLTNNTALTYIILTTASATSIFGIHKFRNQPTRKLRRRLKR